MKKFKNKIHYEYVPLYGVAITFSTDQCAMAEQYDIDKEWADSAKGFFASDGELRNVGIFIGKNEDGTLPISTLAHEAFHCAMEIGGMVGLKPTPESNEETAYLIAWIVNWILDCVKKENA
jgi:hypothetical protein